MLIDVTRKPIHVICEECPTVVVIRTQGLRGKADGLLHQEGANRATGYTVKPAGKSLQGEREYLETILTAPISTKQLRKSLRRALAGQAPLADDPYYTVTLYTDRITNKGGVWRLNFIFDPGPKNTRWLTLLDETQGATLFTIQVPGEHPGIEQLYAVKTPLQRLTMTRNLGVMDLWDVVLEDDDVLDLR